MFKSGTRDDHHASMSIKETKKSANLMKTRMCIYYGERDKLVC